MAEKIKNRNRRRDWTQGGRRQRTSQGIKKGKVSKVCLCVRERGERYLPDIYQAHQDKVKEKVDIVDIYIIVTL